MKQQRPYPRAERVRHALKQAIAAELETLRDPGLGFVTITDVSLSPDLRNATAYYTVYGADVEIAATRDALRRAEKRLRTTVARRVRLRYAPTLTFAEDPVPQRTERLDSIIADLHRNQEDE